MFDNRPGKRIYYNPATMQIDGILQEDIEKWQNLYPDIDIKDAIEEVNRIARNRWNEGAGIRNIYTYLIKVFENKQKEAEKLQTEEAEKQEWLPEYLEKLKEYYIAHGWDFNRHKNLYWVYEQLLGADELEAHIDAFLTNKGDLKNFLAVLVSELEEEKKLVRQEVVKFQIWWKNKKKQKKENPEMTKEEYWNILELGERRVARFLELEKEKVEKDEKKKAWLQEYLKKNGKYEEIYGF